MSVTRDLFTGVATLLDAAGVGTFRASGAYTTSETAITFNVLPDGTGFPDKCICLELIPMTDDITMPLGRIMLSVTCRGARNNPLGGDDLGDAVMNVLHGRTNDVFGQSTVIQTFRFSAVDIGQDANTRFMRADKYYLDVSYPPTDLRPEGGSW